jgi:D-alanyl-D-alanine dipeptidase
LYYARTVVRWLAVVIALAGVARADDKDADLVDVAAFVPDAVLDIKYATTDNFMKEKVYAEARCRLRRAVAKQLVEAAKLLRVQDRRLVLFDCYRPASVQKILWKHNPDPRYVADPKVGSVHSRGAAVDIGLADKNGKEIAMATPYDEASRESWRDRALAGDKGIEARKLDDAMTKAGFVGIATEWWHFDFKRAGAFPLADEPL